MATKANGKGYWQAVKEDRSLMHIHLKTGLSSNPIPAQGQEAKYPSKPVEMVVSFASGGIVDIAPNLCRTPFTGVESSGRHKQSGRCGGGCPV